MRYKSLPKLRKLALLASTATALTLATHSASAFMVQDGTFTTSTGTQAGLLTVGSSAAGPWQMRSTGLTIDLPFPLLDLNLLGPQINVNSGSFGLTAHIGGISVDSNDESSGTITQQLTGRTFSTGQTYVATSTVRIFNNIGSTVISGVTVLDQLATLNANGAGIGFTKNGALTPFVSTAVNPNSPPAGVILGLTLLDAGTNSYQLSLTYTATAADNGATIGVQLFNGYSTDLLALNALSGGVSFDDVVVVPESNTGIMALGALGGLMIIRRRQRRAA